jgi:Winged helix DNA-binding domain
MMQRLDTLQLNRATLDRQLLLRRAARPAREAIEHLAGLQAQAPLAPYVGLWTRLAGFGHDDLKDLLMERIVVRAHLMRNTVHAACWSSPPRRRLRRPHENGFVISRPG